ncbi:MAG: GNAT family N-acetyltransferase [Gammaproteobacteria bacterium]|nr:GNAT family N-acetyltransferase [Gammaproteobacteria bacterium]
MILFKAKKFTELTNTELYEILRLRSEIFVLEQECLYPDIDNNDHKAIHVLGYKNDDIIAYSRLFKPGDSYDDASIGRVLLKESERGFGYAHQLVEFSVQMIEKEFNTKNITIGAQLYLQKFYESHGFAVIGDSYLEDGIPHIDMQK